MKRWLILLYGLVCYLMFFGVIVYSILFIGNLGIKNSLDGEPRMALLPAIAIDLMLLILFALQHSGMARQGFKKWLTTYIPEPAERSTYVLFSNLAMILFFVYWQPLAGSVWRIQDPFATGAIYGLYFLGWGLLFASTFAICHFDLFGLRQVWCNFRGQPYVPHEFRIPMLYNIVRHPLYLGWLVIFWATPVMSYSHLFFAIGTTLYVVIAIQMEEKDLISQFGCKYRDYRKRVPMLIPGMGRAKQKQKVVSERSVHTEV